MRTWVSLILCLTSVPFTFAASSSDQSRVEVAELHPQLVWQRVSPTPQKPDGPVLYQIQLTLGQPNTLPKYDSSGRHFTSSQILDNGSTVVIGGFSINGSNGIVTFASGQTFPLPAAGGDVSGSLSSLKVVGLQTVGVSSALPTSGQVLRFNGITWAPATLAASSGGTVTSITAGSGLAASPGNPITTTGTLSIGNAAVTNAMLANPALTVSAGAGLAGGGSVALGNTITLSNTGLLTLGVSAPLVSTGGQSPTLSLSTVDVAHGGTGVTSSGFSGNFLRSNGTAWVASPIQAADLPALSGTYVDLSSNQTIGGNKIFTANITFNNLITGSISGNATTATTAASATTANNALALGGNAAASYSTTTQNDARYLQLSGGTLTGGLNGTTGTFSGAINAGGLQLPATAVATSVSGANSGAQSLSASVFNSTSSTAQNQTFFWQAEPAAATNNTAAPSGTLNLLFSGTSNSFAPTETGLSVAPSGVIKFAAGQTFPGTGSGTVTNVSGTAPLTVTNASTTPNISIAAAGITNSLLANPSLTVSAGSGLTGGGSVALGGTTTLSVGTGAVTNAMLANPSVTINTGSGLSGGGTLALGGSLTLANTGLLSLGVSAPLASTGGQSPTLSLGTVQIANGGTGITTAPAVGGQFLRSAAAGSWSVGAIQAGDLPSLSGTYVDLATNQSIGGNKTFTGSATFNNLIAGSISGNAATATSAATATNALSLGGNLASAFSTTAQSDARYLQLTGGTMTGAINFAGGQNFPNVLSLTGGTLTGPLSGTSANFSSTGNFGGTLTLAGGSLLPATGTATAATGFNSNAADLVASAFNAAVGINAPQNQTFRWQAEPVNNNQTSASGSLNLLFGSGASTPAETGLSIANNGKITFASGQVFPGAVTSVGTGAGLIGGPITSSGTISVANAGITNAMLANPALTVSAGSGLSGGGAVALGSSISLSLLTSCSSGQILKWNGSAWGCAADANSGGTVTSILSGAGLTGGPISTTGTLSIATAGVTNSMLQNPSLTVSAGPGLTGGATIPLGGTTALNLDTTFTDNRYAAFSGNTNYIQNLSGGTQPGASFNVSGNGAVGGTFTLSPTGPAISGGGFNSASADWSASAFNSTASAAQKQTFRWIAEPVSNNTASPSGKFDLLFGSNGATPAETGLSIASNGQLTFAPGQSFPGVLPLSGGVMTGNVAFAPTQSFPGSVTSVTAADGTITVGGSPSAPTVAVGSITAGNISGGQVVKSFNGLFDNVTLAAGSGISLAPSGQTITIANTGQVAPAWNLGGNAGTGCAASPCTDFLGTADNDPIELRVDNLRALRIEPATDTQLSLGFSPNVIGGFSGNSVTGAGTAGATIAGGGASSPQVNTVSASFGTIGGGIRNAASALAATISGGSNNVASGQLSSVSGGGSNTASGVVSTVAGGRVNTASGQGSFAAGQFTTDFDGTTHHNGVFIWGDNSTVTQGTNANLVASLDNQYLARATGGFEFVTGITPTGAPDASKTVSIAPNSGIISFVAGQTFPGTGNGTVTSITGGTGLTGGTITTTGTLALDTGFTDLRYAAFSGNTNYIQNLSGGTQPGASFNISGDGTVGGTLSAQNAALSGNLALPATSSSSVGVITLGGVPFLHDVLANTFVGQNAGNFTMTGTQDSGFGKNALAANTNGSANSAFGDSAMAVNSGGGLDSAFGALAMANNIVGARDSAFGEAALNSNTTGASNSAFGQAALSKNTTNSGNSAFGTFALLNNTADDNSAFGLGAMQANTIGNTNAAFGAFALNKNTSGSENSAFGQQALMDITTANFNSGFGVGALMLSNGSSNSAFGQNALANLTGGNNDIAVGAGAGSAFTSAESNNIDIGNNGVAGESNTIRIGSGQTSSFIAGNLTLPGTLTMGGNIAFAGTQTFPGTGTVTNIATSTGILGGPITNTGTLSLDTAFTDARYVQKAGDTMTGALNLPADGVAVGSTEFTVAGGYVGIGISSPNAHLGIFSNNAGTPPPSTLPDGRLNADSTNAPQLDLYNADAANGAFITLRAASGASTPWAVYRYGSNGSSAIGANPLGGQANRFCVGVLGVSEPLCAISNGNVGVSGNIAAVGSISAGSFSGNGAQLTNLNPANIGATGIVPIANGGTGSSVQNFVDLSTSQVVNGNKTFGGNITGGSASFSGTLTLSGPVFFTASSDLSFSSLLSFSDGVQFPPSGSASAAGGVSSPTEDFTASAFNSSLNGGLGLAQNQLFRWEADPINNNSANASAAMNLSFFPQGGSIKTVFGVDGTGKVSTYGGATTQGNGVASVLGSQKFTAQSAAIGSTPLFTPSADGLFRISFYAVTTTADTGLLPSIIPSLTWQDDSGAQTMTFNNNSLDLTTVGKLSQVTFVLQGKANQPVSFSTGGTITNGRYSFYITAEQIM